MQPKLKSQKEKKAFAHTTKLEVENPSNKSVQNNLHLGNQVPFPTDQVAKTSNQYFQNLHDCKYSVGSYRKPSISKRNHTPTPLKPKMVDGIDIFINGLEESYEFSSSLILQLHSCFNNCRCTKNGARDPPLTSCKFSNA